MDTNHPQVFANAGWNRLGEYRHDDDVLHAAQTHSKARFLVSDTSMRSPVRWQGSQVQAGWLARAEIDAALFANGECVFLGGHLEAPCFGLLVEPGHAPVALEYEPLREIAPLLSRRDAHMLAWLRALDYWHRTHRYCPGCAAPTVSVNGGHERDCTQCEMRQFPRVDPAIIVLVEDGERCLLGRKVDWETPLYSTLAGFVEPGEALEDAVRREVYEEAGVHVRGVRYHSSQPWPFPASLMLGFLAVADTLDIERRDGELADVRWFTRDKLDAARAQGTLRLPAPTSIAYALLREWYQRGGRHLRESLNNSIPEFSEHGK